MSTVTNVRAFTIPAQALEFVREAMDELHLDDPKLATVALAQIAVEGMRRNPAFSSRIRDIYREQTAKAPAPRPRPIKKNAEPELIPIARIPDWDPDPAGAPRPYLLFQLYGAEQLPRALARATKAELLVSAREVAERHPGTMPAAKATKAVIIDYIVRYVAG